jgi:hypothetical protein
MPLANPVAMTMIQKVDGKSVRGLSEPGCCDVVYVLPGRRVEAEEKVIHPFFECKHNGRPAGNGWNRSTNNAQFGIDYFNRTGTAKSNTFDNRPNETQYFYTDFDASGAQSLAVAAATRSRLRRDRSRRSTVSGR